jgi:gliding motility-associated-like protein
MKKFYISVFCSFLLIFFAEKAIACHALPLVNLSGVYNGISLTVNGSSDLSTCGCGDYYMDVEIICILSGKVMISQSTIIFNKSNCNEISYPTNIISTTSLCPGTTFTWKARERIPAGSNPIAAWMNGGTFTTPGATPNFTVTVTQSPNDTICKGKPAVLNANATGNCGPLRYEWSHGLGLGPAKIVNPTATTTYIVSVLDSCTGVTITRTHEVIVMDPPPQTTLFFTKPPLGFERQDTICLGETVIAHLNTPPTTFDVTWQYLLGNTWQSFTSNYPWTITQPPHTISPNIWIRAMLHTRCDTVYTPGRLLVVMPKPLVDITTLKDSICYGDSTVLIGEPEFTGGNFLWLPTNDTLDQITVAPTNSTTYGLVYALLGCKSDTMWQDIEVLSEISVSVRDTAICNGDSILLTASGSVTGGTYVWSTGDSTQTILVHPSTTTEYWVKYIYENCESDPDTLTLTVNPLPDVLIIDNAICLGASDTLFSVVNPTGGTYLWVSGGETTSYIVVSPSITTTYTLEYTDSLGCINTTDGIMHVAPQPTVTINDTSLCAGDTILFSASSNIPGGSFIWNIAQTGQSFLISPTETINIEVIYDLSGCQSAPDSATITVKPRPQVSVNSETICDGDNVDLELVTNITGGNIHWITLGQTAAQINVAPNTTTSYPVYHELNGCYSDTVIATVIVHLVPQIDAGPDQWICYGDQATLNATGANDIIWDTQETTATIIVSPTVTTEYEVTGENNGCFTTDKVTVHVPIPMSFILSSSDAVCNGQASGEIEVTVTGGYPNQQYTWLDPQGNFFANTALVQGVYAGQYTIQVVDEHNCMKDSFVVVGQPLPISILTSQDSVVCHGQSNGVAKVDLISGGTPPYNYSWQTPTVPVMNSNLANQPAGVYTVRVADDNGCLAISTQSILQPNPLTIDVTPDQLICISNSVTLNVDAINGGNGGNYNYLWFTSTDPAIAVTSSITVSPASTEVYSISVKDSKGCEVIEPVNVFVRDPLNVTINNSINTVCFANKLTISAQGFGGNNQYNYTWVPSDPSYPTLYGNTITIYPTENIIYHITVRDNCGTFPFATTQATVNVLPLPEVDFITPAGTEGCAPTCIVFEDTSDPKAGTIASWEWNIGTGNYSGYNSAQFTHCYSQHGVYDVTLSVITSNGCKNTIIKPGLITIYEVPAPGFIPFPTVATTANPFITFVDTSSLAVHWAWDFDDGDTISGLLPSISHLYADSGTYCIGLTVTSANNCVAQTVECIEIVKAMTVYIPNAFSPNNDGTNDLFFPKGEGINPEGYEFLIFNRWGEKVFESNTISKGWDGKLKNGDIATSGVYHYKLLVKDLVGKHYQYPGTVNLLR